MRPTGNRGGNRETRCFQWFKDTNLKDAANIEAAKERCFQWFKDTNLKANHNCSSFV